MGSIVLQKFGGLVPRVSPRLLGNGEATVATMTKLWSGELRPFLKLGEVENVTLPTDAEVLTLYLLLDKWLAWTTDVDVVTGFTTLSGSGHIYYTGDGAPRQALYEAIRFGPTTPLHSNTYPIGLAGPTTAPTVAATGSGPDGPETYSYVYTFYSNLNEESVPSPPSALVTVGAGAGQMVTVSLFDAAPTNVRELRLYRTIGGTFIFVAAIPAPFPASYVDSATDLDLSGNESLQSQEYYPPPQDIQGLIGLACGSLAAFHGNKVVFSEPYQPGAWPPAYEKIFDYPVVALGTFGQTCVVATTGYTYLVSGNDPRSFAVARIPDPYPCVSKRSMVSADNGCLYSSADGLIFVGTPSYYSQGLGVHVLTRELMTHDEWQVYNPESISGVIFDGRYYGFYRYPIIDPLTSPGAGFILDFSSRPKTYITGVSEDGDTLDKHDILADLDFYASATFANPQVPLHVVVDVKREDNIEEDPDEDEVFVGPVWNELFQWEGGTEPHPLTWCSKQFSFPYAVTFSAGKVIAATYPANLPAPRVVPHVSVMGSGSGATTTRTYVYTFFSAVDVQSNPSPATATVSLQSGQYTLLAGFETPPRTVRGINIYRQLHGAYYLVASVPIPYAGYTDFTPDSTLINNTKLPPLAVLNISLLDGATRDVLYSRPVTSANPFRFPSILGRTEWRIQIESTVNVQMVEIASGFADLIERKVAA